MGAPEGEEREKEIENIFLKTTENFPNVVKKIISQGSVESQRRWVQRGLHQDILEFRWKSSKTKRES